MEAQWERKGIIRKTLHRGLKGDSDTSMLWKSRLGNKEAGEMKGNRRQRSGLGRA